MVARAVSKYVRMSATKVRYLIDNLRGKPIVEVEKILLGCNKRSKIPVFKVIKSAVSNALQKSIPLESLYISKIIADEGPIWHRYRAGTMGRAMPIRKRTCHITVELDVIPVSGQAQSGAEAETEAGEVLQEQGETNKE